MPLSLQRRRPALTPGNPSLRQRLPKLATVNPSAIPAHPEQP